MQILDSLPDTCSADEAASLIASLSGALGIHQPPPDVRTLRLWRSKKHLTIEGRRFTRRNLLEVLVMLKLRQDGLSHQGTIKRTLTTDEARLQLLLSGAATLPVTPADGEALITLQLLAQGILEQYQRVRDGAVVGHTDRMKTGVINTPTILHQAMAHLGRHYFTEGREDRAASIHQLLQLCMEPLDSWAPRALSELEKYRDAILIDPVYHVPNEDCEAIAEEAEGTNLSGLIEHYLHEELRSKLKQLGSEADLAYTTIRDFFGRHPMATWNELQRLYLNPELNNDAIEFVRRLYLPVHASNATGGHIRRCSRCMALIASDGLCVLAGCREDFPNPVATQASLHKSEAFIARPEVLKYWADPAREELRLYDALCGDKNLQRRVHLYPHSDWCDVSIDEDVGVDVKDYRDPVRLAQRLNRSLGNLSRYSERILAIAQRRWSDTYRDRLIEQLSPERRAALQVMSVEQAIRHLKYTHGGGGNAGKA